MRRSRFSSMSPPVPSSLEQILSDIRRNGTRSARSQGILCDLRDETARITRELIERWTSSLI